jgi:hypothetical protein
MLLCRLLLALGFSFAVVPQANADVRFTPGTTPNSNGSFTLATIDIVGIIQPGDYERFLAAYERSKRAFAASGLKIPVATAVLRLDSGGGDMAEAMAIGAQAHATKMTAMVPENAKCISACVLVLAGGIDRAVFGRVGIHRPHVPLDTAFNEVAQKRNFDAIEREVKAYLTQVNVPSLLYDKMFRVSPQNVRYLSATELEELGLASADPYYEEAANAEMAAKLGISKTEFLSRKAAAEKCLGLPKGKFNKCLGDAYAGK